MGDLVLGLGGGILGFLGEILIIFGGLQPEVVLSGFGLMAISTAFQKRDKRPPKFPEELIQAFVPSFAFLLLGGIEPFFLRMAVATAGRAFFALAFRTLPWVL